MFDEDIDFIAIFHVEFLGGLGLVEALAVEQESDIVGGQALALAVGIHEFLELGGGLDLEEDFLAVLNYNGGTWLFTFRLRCSVAGCALLASSLPDMLTIRLLSNMP